MPLELARDFIQGYHNLPDDSRLLLTSSALRQSLYEVQ